MHLVHGELLNLKTVGEWVDSFHRLARKPPSIIVLPGVTSGGPSFDSDVQPPASYLRPGNRLVDWVRDARQLRPGGAEPQVFVSVAPELPFITSDLVALRDQYGTTLDHHACISNPASQNLLDKFVEEICHR
jgi:hypothetical protein